MNRSDVIAPQLFRIPARFSNKAIKTQDVTRDLSYYHYNKILLPNFSVISCVRTDILAYKMLQVYDKYII